MRERLRGRFTKYIRARQLQRRHVVYGSGLVVALLLVGVALVNISPYHAPRTGSNVGLYTADAKQAADQYIYVRAKVLQVRDESGANAGQQQVKVRVLDGPDKGQVISIDRYGSNYGDSGYRRLPIGSEILLYSNQDNGDTYSYIDRYRIPGGVTMCVLLLVLVVVIARWRGITALAGLSVSVLVLAVFVIPRIVHGHDAYLTCIEGAFIIAATSIYLAHGFSKRTTVAFLGAIGTLLLTIGITSFSSYVTGLTGFVDEDSLGVQYGAHHISLASLLFGGIIIASLGVLNDITIGQAAAVDEIYKANRRQAGLTLYKRGMSVGREHIAALVNTLALAYVAVALPAVITTALYNRAPLIVILNSEVVMEEIVRTAVVSISLLLAVPVTTALAAYILPRWTPKVDAAVTRWFKDLLQV